MPRKSKKAEKNFARAGLPLSRATRLKKQTEQLSKHSSGRVFGLSAVAVIALVVAGTMTATDSHSAYAKGFTALDAAKTSFAAWSTPTNSADRGRAQIASVDTSEASIPAPLADTAVEQVASLSARPDGPYCVRMIETHLNALSTSADSNVPLADLKDDLGRLVQNALDCPESGVQIVGSLALASTDIADMRLRWDRDDQILELATVARDASDRPASSVNTQSLELVFR